MSVDASVDTSVLLRFALGDVPDQFERAKALLATPGVSFVVADAAWLEVAYALQHHYHLDRPAIVDVIESLMGIDGVRTTGSVVRDACATFTEHPKLSFTDCYLAEYAVGVAVAPLYTFDEKLAGQHPAAQLVPD